MENFLPPSPQRPAPRFGLLAQTIARPPRLTEPPRPVYGFVRRPGERRAQRGSVLIVVTLLSVFLIGFVGVAVYTGLNMFLQSELSNAAATAAGAGAAAFYDKFDANGGPLKSADYAQTAAADTFRHLVESSPALSGFNAQLKGGAPTIDAARETVTVDAVATIPTALLAPIGIEKYDVSAITMARYARRNVLTTVPQAIDTVSGPGYIMRTLNPPMIDGPGPDLYVGVAPTPFFGYHGVLVEACGGPRCYDVGAAAVLADATGAVADRRYPGGVERRVLYGNFYIDLGAVNTALGYNKNVKKADRIKIIDDGFNDYIKPDGTRARGMEIPPGAIPLPTPAMPGTLIQSVQVMHNAVYCPASGGCVAPTGYVFTPI
ncbi:MAG: hypothetical protein IPK79_12405 [Vampirovibrionales bacterium]|nr:hypothetical protein [Vampirovibrionales bacterium]